MNHYKVTLRVERYKILVIKLIRAINLWGLKESKDFVEREFTFDQYMTDHAVFNVTVNVEQLGRIAHFVTNDNRAWITHSELLYPEDVDVFDFTDAPQGH